jgi:hypothetical protein
MTSYADPKQRLQKILDYFLIIMGVFLMIVIYAQDNQIAELKAELKYIELKEQEPK